MSEDIDLISFYMRATSKENGCCHQIIVKPIQFQDFSKMSNKIPESIMTLRYQFETTISILNKNWYIKLFLES